MDAIKLSNYQLYEIIQNGKLEHGIREIANNEFINRKLSIEEVEQLIAIHDSQFKPNGEQGLKFQYRILLILFPFFTDIQSLIAGRILSKGYKSKWKEYWLYISLGYLMWTVIVILFAKYYLFRQQA